MARTLFLVDGSNNLYRSYFAIRGLTTAAGMATNAVYGFIQMLRKLLKEQKPDAIAVAFDVGGSTHRIARYEDYKKDRKPMPDDLSVQVPLIREVLAGFRIPVLALPDYEADDLLGSLACRARDRGDNVVLATSDKDFFQLVGDGISLYHTTRELLYDESTVLEVFGLPPKQVVDVMAIWGDAIDNIPGVPGIGEKGAKTLITEFGSLENLYANLEHVKKAGQRKALEENRDKAFLSRELATIRCDLALDIDLDSFDRQEPDRAKLHEIFSRLEFLSLMQEFLPEEVPVARSYRIVATAQSLREYLSASDGPLSIHFVADETTIGGMPSALALSAERGDAIVVQLPGSDPGIMEAIRELFASGRILVAHDSKSEMRHMSAAGLPTPRPFIDTMIVSYVLNPGLQSHELESVARDRLKRSLLARKEATKGLFGWTADSPFVTYAAERAEIVTELAHTLLSELDRDPALRKIYDEAEMPLIPVLAKMEQRGIRIDVDLLRSMSSTMGTQIDALEKKIYLEAGETFNINSPTQLATILFDKLQYPVLKKTQKTKSSSTGVEVLKELASHGYAVPQLILEHRELHKLKSTYVDALPLLVAADGRVHTSFNQAVAATGRLSSSDPNLQNIPIRTATGREIRRAFVANEGHVLLAADYSQIELRILAHITQDSDLIDTFRRGADIHRATASKMFMIPEDSVSPDQRRAAKTINFGVLYGMSAFRLSNELDISGTEAKQFIEQYFSRYPRIQEYLDRTLIEARATGKVTTLFGRVRYIPEIHNRSWTVRGNAERMATNAPIQGTAADLLKLAMIELDRRLDQEAPETGMLLTVHDEIVLEVPERDIERVERLVKTTMQEIHPLAVPLAVDTHWGRSWFEAKQ